MTIAIFGNAQKPEILSEVRHLIEFFTAHQVDVTLSRELRLENNREYPLVDDYTLHTGKTIDFALSVGGDGTFLTTASQVQALHTPILGIHCGHLGFLADVQTKDVDRVLEQLIGGQYSIEQRSLLSVKCSAGGHIAYPLALNEVAVLKQGLSSMIAIEASVNGEKLTTYKADGLLVATPTGSTAYNMSIGGPLIVPQTGGILLTPVAPHSLTARPLVVPDDWAIDLVVQSRNGNYMLSVDGRSQIMTDVVTIHIERARETVQLVRVGEHSFIKSLKGKLGWG